MKLFINECSLHSQFFTIREFKEAVKVFYSIFTFLDTQKVRKTVFKSAYLFINYRALRDELFIKSLNRSVRDKSLALALRNLMFNKHNAVDWNQDRQHSLLDIYDYSSKEPPLDSQTVLNDSRRFEAAPMQPQQGRRVYREKETGYYWYVDNFHFGEAAHLEVFSKNHEHLGEANLQGEIDFKTADKNKKLI